MKIKKLTIENFRCFQDFEIDFAPGMTVLIGKNGSGKSSLINAVKHSLSFIFTKDSSVVGKINSISASVPNLKIAGFDMFDVYYNNQKSDYEYPVKITCLAEFDQETLSEWSLQKNSINGKLLGKLYKNAFSQFAAKNYLPLLAYYSDSYPHIKTNISNYANRTLKSFKPIPSNFGYYQWDAETACSEIWEKRLANCWRDKIYLEQDFNSKKYIVDNKQQLKDTFKSFGVEITDDSNLGVLLAENSSDIRLQRLMDKTTYMRPLLEAMKLEKEYEYITKCLKIFSESISDISANKEFEISKVRIRSRLREDYIELEFANGKNILFNNLPAGYRRLLSIVLDIAYRSYILNKRDSGHLSLLFQADKVNGIVVVDEIDLHLHPTLEQEVLQRFQKTFPNIQFIVSTHSPLVISNLQTKEGKNKVYQLIEDQNKPKLIPDIYGLDYNYSLSDVMGTPPRNSEIQYISDSILRLLRRGKIEKVKTLEAELVKLVGFERTKAIIADLTAKSTVL